MNADVIVVGSGAGGLTAATVAALQGLNVVLLEATEYFGGTTAYSGGGVWVPANRYQKEASIDDDVSKAEAYVKAILGDEYNEEKITAYIRTATEMLDYMENKTELKLTATTIPDYEPSLVGFNVGRCLLTANYNGTNLGSFFDKLRRPIPEMGLFGSMQLDPGDAAAMQQWNQSFAALKLTISKMLSHFVAKLKYGRGTFLANGNALAARLLKSADDAGVTLRNNARVKDLIMENDCVVGVVLETNGVREELRAGKAVILASGGFGANPEMRAKYIPQTTSGYNLQPEGNLGDGITMGQKVGAVFKTDNVANAIWTPASRCLRDDGTTAIFPSLCFDRHYPGTFMVDARTGKRFLNEGFHYQSFGEICAKQGVEKIWMIADSRFINKYGMGMVKPWPFSKKSWLKKSYLIEANSIKALADSISVDTAVLEDTFECFNKDARQGKDSEFGRGDDAYSAFMGDATNQPNPGLAPVNKAPFYALEVRPSDLCSLAGLETNALGQVVREDSSVINGLYAVGIDANTVMRGFYPGGGTSLGPAMTFGYIAAKHISQVS